MYLEHNILTKEVVMLYFLLLLQDRSAHFPPDSPRNSQLSILYYAALCSALPLSI